MRDIRINIFTVHNIFFANDAKGGKGEGAEGVPSLVKGHAVGSGARPYAK